MLDGRFDTLATFAGTNGAFPLAGLMQAADGNLYGTTQRGGPANVGTIYRLSSFALAPVRLSVFRTSGKIVLQWPTNGLFTLEMATNLAAPVAWTNVTATPWLVGSNFQVTNSTFAPMQLYRLRKP